MLEKPPVFKGSFFWFCTFISFTGVKLIAVLMDGPCWSWGQQVNSRTDHRVQRSFWDVLGQYSFIYPFLLRVYVLICSKYCTFCTDSVYSMVWTRALCLYTIILCYRAWLGMVWQQGIGMWLSGWKPNLLIWSTGLWRWWGRGQLDPSVHLCSVCSQASLKGTDWPIACLQSWI